MKRTFKLWSRFVKMYEGRVSKLSTLRRELVLLYLTMDTSLRFMF